MSAPSRSVHGTVVAVGEAGVVVRGPSGAGKSRLAQALLAEAEARGEFARLVADDRIFLWERGGRLVATSPDATAGLIEERGSGLFRVAHEPAVVARCVVDLDPGERHARLPAAEDTFVELGGARLPRLRLDRDVAPVDGARRVLALLSRL
jgi:serine kinase of HPr protein (carbohydrate metabolism regulator)